MIIITSSLDSPNRANEWMSSKTRAQLSKSNSVNRLQTNEMVDKFIPSQTKEREIEIVYLRVGWDVVRDILPFCSRIFTNVSTKYLLFSTAKVLRIISAVVLLLLLFVSSEEARILKR